MYDFSLIMSFLPFTLVNSDPYNLIDLCYLIIKLIILPD